MLLKNVTPHLLFFLSCLFPFQAVLGQDISDNKRYLSISHENDMLGGDSDRYYTSGVRVTLFDSRFEVPPGIDKLADKIPTFDLNGNTYTFFTFGQNLYTPADINLREQPADDRPWAAFLYGSVGLATPSYRANNTLSHIDELEFTLGVIGPEALGKQTQKFVHKYISDSPIPQGWDNQLDFEPGLVLSWQRRFPFEWEERFGSVHARLEPNISVSIGNIRSNISTGATLIFGSDPLLDTPPRVRPAIPGTGIFLSQDHKFNWQVFAGIDGRIVGRDIFLDGNSFSSSHSVNKEYFVGDLSTGLSFFYDDYRLSYTFNVRSKEFKCQNEESIFGSVTLTKRF
ncbi:MAG: lipid A deacylase LpxR family protein [Alphaproteobacteria bacterium]|nr:lipid A deacylase LpxR family protein [Alphaproteobacteria bacterium]